MNELSSIGLYEPASSDDTHIPCFDPSIKGELTHGPREHSRWTHERLRVLDALPRWSLSQDNLRECREGKSHEHDQHETEHRERHAQPYRGHRTAWLYFRKAYD
jgi:hypothetical protein